MARINAFAHRSYARRTNLGKHPKNTTCLVSVFITKSGNHPSENQYFSTFQIPLEPSAVEKYWFSSLEFPLLKMKPKRGNGCYWGYFPKYSSSCIGPIHRGSYQASILCIAQYWSEYFSRKTSIINFRPLLNPALIKYWPPRSQPKGSTSLKDRL